MQKMQKSFTGDRHARYTRDFLNHNDHDSALYDILLNNDRSNPGKIAQIIAGHIALHEPGKPGGDAIRCTRI